MQTASLIITCKDVKGIILKVTSFLYNLGANVIDLEQHIEDDTFFMRIEWDLKDFKLNKEEFAEEFSEIKNKYEINSILDYKIEKKKIALFCSKELHCLLDIINRKNIDELDIEIAFVASNFTKAEELVSKFDIPFYHVKKGENQEKELLEALGKHKVDCVGLARYMKILSEDFLIKANLPIINVHHSFLPSFIGAKPYDEAYARGVKIIGATAHYVTKELDQGQIIEQEILRINHGNSINELKTLGRKCEKEAFAVALKKHLENKIVVYKNRTIIFN